MRVRADEGTAGGSHTPRKQEAEEEEGCDDKIVRVRCPKTAGPLESAPGTDSAKRIVHMRSESRGKSLNQIIKTIPIAVDSGN